MFYAFIVSTIILQAKSYTIQRNALVYCVYVFDVLSSRFYQKLDFLVKE